MSSDLYTFSLSNEEVNLLKEISSQKLLSLKIIEELKEKIVVEIQKGDVEQFREVLTEQLAIRGFKEDYSLNTTGEVIEDLIDKLYKES